MECTSELPCGQLCLQGYEDEMYCPSEFCLRGKPPREDGMVGGKSLFFECHNPTTGIVEGAVFLYPTHANHMSIHMSIHMPIHMSIHMSI